MPMSKRRKAATTVLSLILSVAGSNAHAQEGSVLKFEWCRGACDRDHKNLGEWGTQFIHPPKGEQCLPAFAITAAMDWIKEHEPGALLAGWGCVNYENQL